MSPELREQIDGLKAILASVNIPLDMAPGASEEEIAEVESQTGIQFGDDMRALWKFSNGARKHGCWFAVMTDELTGCELAPLKECIKTWRLFENISNSTRWLDDKSRDARIRPRDMHRKGWFPFAEFNGFSTAVYFDARPNLLASERECLL